MHKRHWIITGIFFLLSLGICFAQRDQHEIQRKQKELQKLRDDIQKYEKRIQESDKREQVTLDRLDDLEHQSDLIRQLLQKLHDEELRTDSRNRYGTLFYRVSGKSTSLFAVPLRQLCPIGV